MQWYLFANISDNSWLYAYNCLENKSRFNVIDIGSNIGAFTLKLAKKCYENKKEFNIYSFEPNKHIFKTLENNIKLNKKYLIILNILKKLYAIQIVKLICY